MAPPEKESGGSGTTGALAAVGMACGFVGAVIGAVGWHMWKKGEMQQQHQSCSGSSKTYNTGGCPICLSDMEELQVLSCGHQYHKTCIDGMMRSGVAQNCPICRKHFGK